MIILHIADILFKYFEVIHHRQLVGLLSYFSYLHILAFLTVKSDLCNDETNFFNTIKTYKFNITFLVAISIDIIESIYHNNAC